ncbi:MAG: ABC transporter ATP-binding protein [Bowdeniella nasicola]|nr:ABC transporter ATP-binding protein [Bowdeniella nasicola]
MRENHVSQQSSLAEGSARTSATAGGVQPTASTDGVVIEVDGLTRRYGKDFTAVDNVSFSVREGEIFGLLGTNGAGKTSTLEVLEGLAPSQGGQVRVFGLDPRRDRHRIRPHQGVMMQEGGFPTDLTVRETLAMWAGTLSNPMSIDETLDAVGLNQRAGVRVKALSGGEVRRLDLACAIVGQPALLFLDEPTTGLDPQSRRTCWQLIERLHQQGTTVVLTTHYLEEADRLCDRLVLMHEGTIARSGTHAEVVAGYPSTISVRNAPDLFTQLPDQLRHDAHESDGRLIWKTEHLQRDLTALLTWAASANVHLSGLTAREADLESVFLDIAGQQV